ncbi:MAG: hypothetical protein ACK53Y_01320 [bacterium]
MVYRKPDIEPAIPISLIRSPDYLEQKRRGQEERRKTVDHNLQQLLNESKQKYQLTMNKEIL